MRYSLLALCLICLVGHSPVEAVEISVARPGDREFVRDQAQMLSGQDRTEIIKICDRLLSDKATPIVVVTIEKMSDHGGAGMRIETFARLLFDQWEIGHAQLGGQPWNTGILLLVSRGDRMARIELGNGWGREKDALTEQIMHEQIIPYFKQGDFSGGIKAGVVGLEAMARERPLPPGAIGDSKSSPKYHPLVIVAVIGLVIFTVVSLARHGSDGWAWIFWAVVFSLVGWLLYEMLINRSHRGRDSFGGGSFGGGYSGGGGASGSW